MKPNFKKFVLLKKTCTHTVQAVSTGQGKITQNR